jgi:putative Mg2+ transporter-C (MgtC) family protein
MYMRDPWFIENSHIVLRLLLSVLLGALVGYERERNNHAAGLRTHTLVCLGSCLIMILSIYGFAEFAHEPNVRLDPARLAAQVITGVGFLGAGTILFTGKSIKGLTTAASIWVVMAVGLAVGAGFYMPAVLSGVLVLLILWGLNIVERRYMQQRRDCYFTVTTDSMAAPVESFQKLLLQHGAKLSKVRFLDADEADEEGKVGQQHVLLTVSLPQKEYLLTIADEFKRIDGVRSVTAAQ